MCGATRPKCKQSSEHFFGVVLNESNGKERHNFNFQAMALCEPWPVPDPNLLALSDSMESRLACAQSGARLTVPTKVPADCALKEDSSMALHVFSFVKEHAHAGMTHCPIKHWELAMTHG